MARRNRGGVNRLTMGKKESKEFWTNEEKKNTRERNEGSKESLLSYSGNKKAFPKDA